MALLQFVDTVWTDGVAFVRDAPTNEEALRALAQRVGHIRATNFGPDFHVEAMVEPNNVAYTSVELRPHTDIVNHEHPPGVQFLHCFVADAPGGESTLVDGFWVADRVREEAPEDFRLLCDVRIPYRFHDADHDLRVAAPVIGLDAGRRLPGDPLPQRPDGAAAPAAGPGRARVRRAASLRRHRQERGGADRRAPSAGRRDGVRQPSRPARAQGVRPGRRPPPPVRLVRRRRTSGDRGCAYCAEEADMAIATNGDCELYYDTFGDPPIRRCCSSTGSGASASTIADEWCQMFAGRGFHVVRFDNRDVGLSTSFEDAPLDGEGRPTGCRTWPTTASPCSTRVVSRAPT